MRFPLPPSPLKLRAVPVVLTGLLLAGCAGEDLTRTFGLTRDAPDEFTVTTRAPLSMPPEFSLRPPRPGAARPQEQSDRRQAELALVPQAALSNNDAAPISAGQEALLQQAGAPAPANIRSTIEQDQQNQPKEGFVDRMMFWKSPPPPGTVLDADRESQRLRENAALGRDPEVGNTPIIQPQKKGFLQGVFGGIF